MLSSFVREIPGEREYLEGIMNDLDLYVGTQVQEEALCDVWDCLNGISMDLHDLQKRCSWHDCYMEIEDDFRNSKTDEYASQAWVTISLFGFPTEEKRSYLREECEKIISLNQSKNIELSIEEDEAYPPMFKLTAFEYTYTSW